MRAQIVRRPQPVYLGIPPPPRVLGGDEPPYVPPPVPVTIAPPKPPAGPKILTVAPPLPPVIKLPGVGKPPTRVTSTMPGSVEAVGMPGTPTGADGLNASVNVSALPFGLSMPVLLGGAGLALFLVTRSSDKKK